MLPPHRIAMSGGGMKGIAHVGALEVLEARGLLRKVREYIGTSAGALMAFCICIGYTIAELRDICLRFDFTMLQTLEPESMLSMMDTFGLDTGENLDKLLRALLKTKGHDPEMTFGDLAATGAPSLRVYAVDIHACREREFSAATTPGTPLRVAVAASMAIPLYFAPVRDPATGRFHVDGGLIAHFPFHHLTDVERQDTIGIAFNQTYKVCGDNSIDSFIKYILQLYYSVYNHHNERLIGTWAHRILLIPCGQFPSLQFDSGAEQKEALLAAGRAGAEEFLAAGGKGPKPARRHSF
jgi:NTE family protein